MGIDSPDAVADVSSTSLSVVGAKRSSDTPNRFFSPSPLFPPPLSLFSFFLLLYLLWIVFLHFYLSVAIFSKTLNNHNIFNFFGIVMLNIIM